MKAHWDHKIWTCALALSVGCYSGLDAGMADDPSSGAAGTDTGGPDPDGSTGTEPTFPDPQNCEMGLAPLRRDTARLTRQELVATYGALLGPQMVEHIESTLALVPPDRTGLDLDRLSQDITSVHVTAYFRVAEAVGRHLEQDADARRALIPCLENGDDVACVSDFIADFGARAYRRPLTETERQRLLDLFEVGAEESASTGLRMVLTTMFQSPSFVFHLEVDGDVVDADERIVALTDHEIASRLSYYLWGEPPDEDLRAAADASQLQDPAVLEQHVDRLLADDRAADHFQRFFSQWLATDQIPSLEDLADHIREDVDDTDLDAAIANELSTLIRTLVLEDDASYRELLTTDLISPHSPGLAQLYGVQPTVEGEFVADAGRRGLLTRVAFLADPGGIEHPLQRGTFIREQFLCTELALPEGDIGEDIEPPALDPDATTRERFEAATASPECAACHGLINPPAFAMGGFDGMGRARDMETVFDETGTVVNMLPVDTNVGVIEDVDPQRTIDGATALSEAIAESSLGRRCMAQTWVNLAAARPAESDDKCYVEEFTEMMADSDIPLLSALRWYTSTVAFVTKRIED